MASFTHVSVPGVFQFPPIAYALFSPERTARGLPSYGVTSEHVNVINAFLADPDWQELGTLRLLRRDARRARARRSLDATRAACSSRVAPTWPRRPT